MSPKVPPPAAGPSPAEFAPGDPLAGKTALITGAAKRLGRAVALALAGEGVHVVIHCGKSLSDAEKTASDAREKGGRAHVVQADLGDPAAVESLFERALAAAGPLDILVNNASIFPENHIASFTPEDLQKSLQVNALAPLALARAFASQNRDGSIVQFLDTRIRDYDAKHATYHLSKRMLFTLTRMMALEYAPRIRVNAVAPGLILPPPGEDESYLEKLAHTNPLGRHGTAEDVAAAVVFLLKSAFITGQVIFVDGGRHMRGGAYA